MATLRALAAALIPRGGPFPLGAADVDTAGRVAGYLERYPAFFRHLFAVLLTVFEYLPLASHWRRPFSRLAPSEQQAFLHECEASRLPLKPLLLRLFKALCLPAFCSDPRVEEALGYTGACLDETPFRVGPRLEPIAYPDIRGTVEEQCDVVVVGSGAGGAVAAKELAEGGLSVIVVEEGAYFTSADFQGPPFERIQRLYRDGGLTFALGRPPIPVPLGKAVGGTTVVNSGTCFRPSAKVLQEWESRWGIEGVDLASMEPLFRRVEETISVRPVPRELLGANALAFERGVQALGYHGAPINRNITDCHGCGVCAFGCPSDAKQAVHLSYLPRAAEAGARIYARCRVDRLLVEGGRALGVEADILERDSDIVRGRLRVRAKTVVLAAGAVHTPALLMANGLAGASGQLGRNLRIHPATAVAALFPHEVYGWRGTLQSYCMDDFAASDGLLFEVTAPVPALGAAALPGAGLAIKEGLARYKHLASVGLFVSDTSSGRVRRLPGRREPLLTYALNRTDAARLQKGIAIAAEVFLAAGASSVITGLRALPTVSAKAELERLKTEPVAPASLTLTGFHPMGTCRMGRDPAKAVVDPWGQVHGLRGLFIADASVFPTGLGVNPQVTIMAMATRIAFHLLGDRAGYFG